ncbi:MAG TPA: S53 family peptidase [Solirubrobacteraceae bacterium]|nr:S53 family peptidase [Solirubrobacteraceae bacterium]
MRQRAIAAAVPTLVGACAAALTLTFTAAPAFAGATAGEAGGLAAVQSASPAATQASQVGETPGSTPIEFDVGVRLPEEAAAVQLEREVSDPSSPSYRHYLTPKQWEKRFSPTRASVRAVRSWLEAQGIAVEGVTPDRMTIEASATAATVERAFGTSLGEFRQGRQTVRLASEPLKVPSSVASLIAGVSGVDQHFERPQALTGAPARSGAGAPAAGAKRKGAPIPPPPGFRVAPPCSGYYGEKLDTSDPHYGDGYPYPLPYAVCGYTPPQLQSAYGLRSQIAGGVDGAGVTVAIVDAYEAPTLFADAHEYSERNQPGQTLEASQFSELISKRFTEEEPCEAEEWSGEQTLDVEAVHATAPGAQILYVGAKNCGTGLYKAVQQVVDGHLAEIITDSWGEDGGDLLEGEGARRSFDDVLLMAGATGIGVQFAAGDEGDEFSTIGIDVGGYPETSPYQTSVGGTSLEVGPSGERLGEYGWSTSVSVLCNALQLLERYPGCKLLKLRQWLPPAPGEYDYGGGGATSYVYPEPWYQEGVVPQALAERNAADTYELNRVEPDISMDADPSTGMLVGETQEFPDGVYYDQYRIGGTSLSSPLFAGVMADADQAAGEALGFVNPLLYQLESSPATAASAFYDVVPGGKQALARNDYVNSVGPEEGLVRQVRVLEYEGVEEHCDGAGHCEQQNVELETAPGFDSMTGVGTPGDGFVATLAGKP